ncbi:hypothetical protein SLEP1_g23197 [Rubroshorea leprosula]|uniref:Uncharacterized protein n=1 Tax=Rubroshorea leprosula TaxID=152421 RepID=A0AAV5JGX1_9ROSI|nr:hypothetical protein SLEP1_g23197 [Rubroshorea leprosula]
MGGDEGLFSKEALNEVSIDGPDLALEFRWVLSMVDGYGQRLGTGRGGKGCGCYFLSKKIKTDLEEEKAQEISKLHDALHAMQMRVEKGNARVIKERKAARKAIEEAPPIIKEAPVIVQDTEKVDQLTAEAKSLKTQKRLSADS